MADELGPWLVWCMVAELWHALTWGVSGCGSGCDYELVMHGCGLVVVGGAERGFGGWRGVELAWRLS